MRPLTLLAVLTAAPFAHAQWTLQDAHTTADLRGIAALPNGTAWASGSSGTILRTEDAGFVWQLCAVPPGAEHLDFRGIQAFDQNTALVMSSGKGDLSRLYKTTDGCQTWKLLFTNPDSQGFWDALTARITEDDPQHACTAGAKMITGSIFGDPAVHKSNPSDRTEHPSFYLAQFTVALSCGDDELRPSISSIFSTPGESAFAASNSVLKQLGPDTWWIAAATRLIQYSKGFTRPSNYEVQTECDIYFPTPRGIPSAGVFSFAIRPGSIASYKPEDVTKTFYWKAPSCHKADVVAVGGDYLSPDTNVNTAVFTAGSNKFLPALTPPHGYRSSVAYDPTHKTWITVGPNGTDISTDDGRNWHALKPSASEAPDTDKNWNALSLPYVVGPHGRIARLREDALK